MYWASEKWMLDAMESKFNVSLEDIYKPNKHYLFKWTLDKFNKLVQETRELKPAPEKAYSYVVHHNHNHKHVPRNNGYYGYPSGDKLNQPPLLGQSSDTLNTIRGWGLTKCFNHFKTVYDFNKEMGECALCSEPLMYSTSYMVDNTDVKTGFCGDCVTLCLKEGEDPCVVQSLK